MAYLKKTKRSKRKMRKTKRIRGGMFGSATPPVADPKVSPQLEPGGSGPVTESEKNLQNQGEKAGVTKQALAELEQAMVGLNKAVELLKQ